MISGIILLLFIGYISYLYNLIIYPYVILIIPIDIYNICIVFIIIIVQLDNFNLFYELKNNNKNDELIKFENKYRKIITTQMGYIIEKQNELNRLNNIKKTLNMRSKSR